MSERKRQKIETNKILNTISITKFEDLPNELILICFAYFDFYYLYELFSDLNQRFNKLIEYQAKIYIDLNSVPNEKFLTFCFKLNQLILTNKNYPLSLNTSDEYKFTLLLNDDLFKEKFSKLKSLSISSIKVSTLSCAIFSEETKLYEKLERLSLLDEISGERQDVEQFCNDLISSKMKLLKYLNLNFEPYSCGCDHGIAIRDDYVDLTFEDLTREKSFSQLETLIIGYISDDDVDETSSQIKISFNTLTRHLLPFLPKLKNLIINSVHFNKRRSMISSSTTTKTNLIFPLNLKLIKIWTDKKMNQTQDDEKKNRKTLEKFFINNNSAQTTTIQVFNINNKNVLIKEL